MNRRFRAFDQETGEVLWETILAASVTGMPISYAVDGQQFVAIPVGGGTAVESISAGITPEIQAGVGNNAIFVFALPD